MRALDLFCGAGGAAKGLRMVFDEVIGIDIAPQPDYPGQFKQGNALALPASYLREFDFIWASPPCQAYSSITKDKSKHPKLIEFTRDLLIRSGKPFVIENVPPAPIRRDLFLCGEMFELCVIRHRYFEIEGFSIRQPKHRAHRGACQMEFLRGNAQSWEYFSMHGNMQEWKRCRDKLGLSHIQTKRGLTESIPWQYSHYIAQEFTKGVKQLTWDWG